MGSMLSRKSVALVTECLLESPNYRKATRFVSPKEVVKATRQCRFDSRAKTTTILVTFGAPNFVDRQFIKACKRAGEPFPVKKIQIKFWSKKKK